TATIFPFSASGAARRSIWRDVPFLLMKAVWFRSLARRAARAGATRSALVLRPFILLESARCAAGAGAVRSVVLFF
ncbi:hypothetical protein A2U01_0081332, partial [Trifolium medium]|nr:hypothetical protein [Trifolium medium]